MIEFEGAKPWSDEAEAFYKKAHEPYDPMKELFEAIYAAVEDLTISLAWTQKVEPGRETDVVALRSHRDSCQQTIDRLVKWFVLAGRQHNIDREVWEGLLELVGLSERYYMQLEIISDGPHR